MSEETYPQYISHKPLGKDLFEGGSQKRLADCISNEIATGSPENNRRLIGIDGSWGSGKSNVIEILKNKLGDDFRFFLYDAWGHQEDAHRRSILEGLIKNLSGNNLLPEKTTYTDLTGETRSCTWDKKIHFLLSRKKRTDNETVPRLSAWVVLLGLAYVLTPSLAIIVGHFDNPDTPLSPWLKIGVPLAPLLTLILAYLGKSLCEWKMPNLGELFAVYKGEVLTTTTFEAISDMEPSIDAFKVWISELSGALKVTGKKLVIVFDNMDRLRPNQIKELWGTIHTFFAEGHGEYENIWVVVPFDREHLRKAFAPEDDAIDGAEEANQFINKSFSVVYQIAPPILTDWKKFYIKKFQEAFGKRASDKQRETTLRIFDLLKPRFTPRDIISFINELVQLKKLWVDAIELKYMALFSLQKKLFEDDPVKTILENKCLEKGVVKYFSDSEALQKNLAALTYNVPVNEAYQLVIYREIELAFREGHNTSITSDMLKDHHFIELMEEVAEKAEFELDSAVTALNKIKKSKNEENAGLSLGTIWRKLLQRALGEVADKLSFTKTHRILLSNIEKEEQSQLSQFLCDQYSKLIQLEGEKKPKGSDLYQALDGMRNALSDMKSAIQINEIFPRTKVTASTFIEYLHAAKENYSDYPVTCDLEELDEYCAELMPDDIRYLAALRYFKPDQDFVFKQTQEALDAFRKESPITAENFNDYLEASKAIAIEKFDIPLLYQLLTQVPQDTPGYHDLLAMRLCYGAPFQTLTIQQVQPINQQKPDPTASLLALDDAQLSQGVAKVIEYYGDYGDLLEALPSWPQPFLKSVVSLLTEHPVNTSNLAIISVLSNYQAIFEQLDVDKEVFLSRLDGWRERAKKSFDLTNVGEIPTLFFEHAANSSLEIAKLVIELKLEYLNGLSEDEWIQTLQDEDDSDYKITTILLNSGHMKSMPDNAVRAYKDLLIQMAKSEAQLDDNFVGVFYKNIHKSKLKGTLKKIRDEFINHVDITPELFQFFMPMMIANADLSSKSGDVARRMLTPVIDDLDCLSLIVEHADSFAPLIEKSGDDAEDFKDELRQLIEDSEDDALIEFAKRIGIDA